jgi:hypothetical protein
MAATALIELDDVVRARETIGERLHGRRRSRPPRSRG